MLCPHCHEKLRVNKKDKKIVCSCGFMLPYLEDPKMAYKRMLMNIHWFYPEISDTSCKCTDVKKMICVLEQKTYKTDKEESYLSALKSYNKAYEKMLIDYRGFEPYCIKLERDFDTLEMTRGELDRIEKE